MVARSVLRYLLIAIVVTVFSPRPAKAQQDDPTAEARMRMGPVYLTPTFSVVDIGVDSNVLNDDVQPEADFTATIRSGLQAVIRLGPTFVIGAMDSDFVYFQKFSDQRYTERGYTGTLLMPIGRVRASVNVDTRGTRSRPTTEIDTRARRTVNGFGATFDVALTSRTAITTSGRHATTRFDDTESFRGVSLRDVLDATVDSGEIGLRYTLTPLTDVTVGIAYRRDQFVFSPERDATSLRFVPRFEFSPGGFLRGRAEFGYMRFQTVEPSVPDFSGVVALVGASYTLLGITNFDIEFTRDVTYSFEVSEPFYVSTGGALEITQRLFGPLDLILRGGREQLDYESIEIGFDDGRIDTVNSYGGGFGVRLGETAGFKLTAEYSDRRSNRPRGAGFGRTRIFGSADYGF